MNPLRFKLVESISKNMVVEVCALVEVDNNDLVR